MSTRQLNNKENQFIVRESTHNIMSAVFFIFIALVSIILIITSSLLEKVSYTVLASAVAILIFSISKIIVQFRTIIRFSKLVKNIEEDSIPFYITKSWNRKKESTIWFSAILLTIVTIMLIVSLVMRTNIIFDVIVLFITIIMIIVSGYLNIQNLEGNLKLSNRKIDLNSMEWLQIKKETRIFYRLIFVYFISILLIIPLILLIVPGYRNWIYKIVKN